ncbi:D-ribose pyranase [Xylanibacillus composti]|uniref:D-ribose pyranase n=1 Tax=Xylanibacillus composti TaxID=1572762 RepID=A0A8J4H107_9BACL|nr:D-ribose pyranase [Xylanibacillus composti]MDT9726534.1 D-ribose pyranase [Xylanibacillus composti]GIQ68953.1 D-ribose pyranase [Xylanibacillus composti]
MKRSQILNKDLNEVIAGMGHGDWIIVCDAGFPIPNAVRRVDLAIQRDLPDLETVLRLITEDFIAEKVYYAEEMPQYNPPLINKVKQIFNGIDLATMPHEKILSEAAYRAKAVVRTGAFDPYGNIILQSGVDAPKWFNREGVLVPDAYKDRV